MKFRNPSYTLFIGEKQRGNDSLGAGTMIFGAEGYPSWTAGASNYGGVFSFRHNLSANYVCFDGHNERLKANDPSVGLAVRYTTN